MDRDGDTAPACPFRDLGLHESEVLSGRETAQSASRTGYNSAVRSRLFVVGSAISLLLSIAVVFLWIATAYDPYGRVFEIPFRDRIITPGPRGLMLYRHGWMALFAIPYWLLGAIFAVLPLIGLVRNRRPHESRMVCAVRRLLNGVCLISFLIFGVTAVLWGGSYFIAESFTLKTAHYLYDIGTLNNPDAYPSSPAYVGWIREISIRTDHGLIDVRLRRSHDRLLLDAGDVKSLSRDYPQGSLFVWERKVPAETDFRFERSNETPTFIVDRFGFFLGTNSIRGIVANLDAFHVTEAAAPTWFIAALTSILPGIRVFIWLRFRRHTPPGFCARCRNNLTGNTSGVCPECGMPVPPKSEAAA